MVYVIAAAYSNNVTSEQLIANKKLLSSYTYSFSIKIGYTTDFTKRRSQYFTDTPKFFVLFTYEDGTEEDERRLHLYFSKFMDDSLNGREWFKWDEEIIEFFESHPTIESIRKTIPLLKVPLLKRNKKATFNFETLVNPILYKLIEDEGDNEENNYKRLLELHNEILKTGRKFNTVSELFPILKIFYDSAKIDEISNWYTTQSSLVVDIETKVQYFSTIIQFTDKMRYICEELIPTLDQDHRELFLNSIPMMFKIYYITLGPERCKALSYQKGNFENEIRRLYTNQGVDIKAEVTKIFLVGQKYTKAYIKATLAALYKKIGYDRPAKASDLNDWFNIKPCLVPNKETKKRDNGFEIVGIKY